MLNGLAPFKTPGRWLKGNLHCHTTRSDGAFDLQTRIRQYKELGYDFLAITDHRRISPEFACEDAAFVVLSGVELHPAVPWSGRRYHLVVPQVPDDFPIGSDAGPLTPALRELAGRRIPFIIGHPYWCGHDLEQLLPLAPLALGIEVYNTCTSEIGRALSAVYWDDLLTRGFHLSGVAVDDCHFEHKQDVGGAWTMIRAGELDAEAIMDALVGGRFYASSGPAILDFSFESGMLSLATEPVRTINFVATASDGYAVSSKSGETISAAKWKLPENFSGYVRAECYLDHQHAAWTNPVFFRDGMPLE